MADSSKEEAQKKRIIEHMNRDHKASLNLFLQHTHQVDLATVSHVKLVDVNASQLILVASGKSYTIPIDPPMSSLAEARSRLAQMDDEARFALGLPPASNEGGSTLVPRFVAPRGNVELFAFFAFLASYVVFARQENLRPGSFVYDRVLKSLPADLLKFLQRAQAKIFYGTLGVHAAEAALLAFWRLRKYDVPLGGLMWWKWTLSALVDGILTHNRLTVLVTEQKRGALKAGRRSAELKGRDE